MGIREDLCTDAVAYWKMDEASGTRVDATGRGNNLTPINAPPNVAGKVGNAVDLTKTSLQELIGNNASDVTMTGTDFYIALWVYLKSTLPSDANIGYTFIIKDDVTNIVEYEIFAGRTTGSYGRFFGYIIVDSSFHGYIADTGADTATPNEWHFLELYFDNTAHTMGIALDHGSFSVDHRDIYTDIVAADNNVYIGNDPIGYDPGVYEWYHDGYIDEVGIWKRILTQNERDYLWNKGRGIALFGSVYNKLLMTHYNA